MNPKDEETEPDISSIYAFDSAKDFDIFFRALCDRFGVDPDDEFFKKKKDD